MRFPRLFLLLALLPFAWLRLAAPSSAQSSNFTFTTVGDLGSTTNTDGVLNGIAASGAQFHLALGDLSYSTVGAEGVWCNYVQSKVGATFPFELVSGNHDADGSPNGHIDNFVACLPDRIGNLTGTYGKEYYFDYSNLARVIMISPNLTLDGETYTYTVGNAHYNWLANAIDGARAANIPWVIVGMHKVCITIGVKSCEIGPDVLNLLVSKKVDLILEGHDHNYQRSKQLALNAQCAAIVPNMYNANCVSDDGADQQYPKGGGAVLMIVGTGGQSIYPSNHTDSEVGYFARYVRAFDEVARYGFLQVNVTSSQLNAQFVGTSSGSTFTDSFVINATSTATPTPSASATNTATRTATTTATHTPTKTFTAIPAATRTATRTPTKTFTTIPAATRTATRTLTKTPTRTWTPTLTRAPSKTFTRTATRAPSKTFTRTATRTPTLTPTRVRTATPTADAPWTWCANANFMCKFSGTKNVRFGINGKYVVKSFTNGVMCSVANFGDPYPGVPKQCWHTSATLTPTPTRKPTRTSTKTSQAAEVLATFRAKLADSARVRVSWRTLDQTDVVGFNVWRRVRGSEWVQLNTALIVAKQDGSRYRWLDRNIAGGAAYLYKLQILRADSEGAWSDAVKVKVP